MPRRKIATLLMLVAVLSGCSSAPSAKTAKGPIFVTFEDRRRATIEPALNVGTYNTISDHINAESGRVLVDTDVPIGDTILNDGLPSKGIRLTVRGSAVTNGLLSMPKEATARGSFADKKQPDSTCPIHFTSDNSGAWQAKVEDVAYGTQVNINMICQALKGGRGDVQIFVYPLDKQGKTSAIATHRYNILSETEQPADIEVPVDR